MPETAPSSVLTLSRLRLSVQLLMLVLTVWGGTWVGHYAAEKISKALPALSCAYDRANGAYCVLIPLQHQMHHRVGEMIQQTGHFALRLLLPLAFTLLAVLLSCNSLLHLLKSKGHLLSNLMING